MSLFWIWLGGAMFGFCLGYILAAIYLGGKR